MKRLFDIFLGCLAALILFVLVLLVAVAVRFTSKGPALYWSDRVGRNNVIFKMPKFRSMRVGTMTASTIGHRTRCSLEAPARARRIVVAPKNGSKTRKKTPVICCPTNG